MHRAREFFSNLTGQKVSETSDIKEDIGDFSLGDLNDLTFPISKNEVLETLSRNGSSNLLIEAVEKVDQDMFNNLNDLRGRLPI